MCGREGGIGRSGPQGSLTGRSMDGKAARRADGSKQ
jgi:hypothetical protein